MLFDMLAPAFAGIASGVAAGFLTAYFQAKAFRRDWKRAREDMIASYAIDLINKMATDLVTVAHAMWWLAWRTQASSYIVGTKQIDEFDLEIRRLLPRIHGAHAALQVTHPRAAEELEDILKEIDRRDLDFANRCAAFRGKDPVPLQEAADDAEAFRHQLPELIKGCTDWLGKTGWLDRPKANEVVNG